MQKPRVDGLNVLEIIGHGECGRVYRATDPDGKPMALKIFDDSAIDRKLIESVTLKLEQGGWPDGLLPVIAREFEKIPIFQISPLMAETNDDGSIHPRSLQHQLENHPGQDSWKLVKSLARALAAMHTRGVAHGNLKPGNVMFDDKGDPLLCDWAMGNMPGVKQCQFTDAYLYQPPEQLRDTAAYLRSDGLKWDVFAFGVLAFRILTGTFPRCDEVFKLVAPPPGETRRDGIHADVEKIARNLESQKDFEWPYDPQNPLEAGYRKWIERCLAIKAEERPFSMVEVLAGFDAAANEESAEKSRQTLVRQRLNAERFAWVAIFALGAAAATAAVFAGLWKLTETRLAQEIIRHENSVEKLQAASQSVMDERNLAEEKAANATQAEQALNYEKELWSARLEASRMIGDRLFSWAMEKGHRRLPPLDGRELRLKRLDRYFEDFLTRTADLPEFEDEQARARLQLAEISLAAGDAAAATKRLDDALKAWPSKPMDADLKLRLATDSLLLALLRQSTSDAETEASFVTARKAFADVPRTDVDVDRLDQLLSILDFHEAKELSARGDAPKALEQLMRATQTLNRIAEQRPDSAVLRSELAACYLSSATILEGIGTLGDAREARSLALAVLTRLHKETPEDHAIRLDLAGCYGTMAETAVMAGDISGAESLNKEAISLLDKLLAEQPDLTEALSRKAAQLGLRAGIDRDRGEAAAALKNYDDGIRMLEAIRASAPDNAMASYRLALLWWQKGRMMGMNGNCTEEIALIGKAKDLLATLESDTQLSGPRPEQLQRSAAYLSGDLGHAQQLAGRKDDAARSFSEAVSLWQGLLESRAACEEYTEALSWCRQRLQDLK